MKFIKKNIVAICHVLEMEHLKIATNNTHVFISKQMQSLPDYLKPPFILAHIIFSFFAFITHLKPFHKLALPQQKKILAAWRTSKFHVCKTYLKFYEALVIYDLSSKKWNIDE